MLFIFTVQYIFLPLLTLAHVLVFGVSCFYMFNIDEHDTVMVYVFLVGAPLEYHIFPNFQLMFLSVFFNFLDDP